MVYDIEDISTPSHPALEACYELYSQVFTLEEERETIDGFRKILALNASGDVQRAFGPLQETISFIAGADGQVLGLANFIVYAYPQTAFEFEGSAQLNFLCVAPSERGQGLAQVLLRHIESRCQNFARAATGSAKPNVFITIEQNNAARMTTEQREEDEAATHITPEKRSQWWHKQGYRRLDFPYAQPPLSPDQKSCTYIDYFVHIPDHHQAPHRSLPAQQLLEHLRRFFFVSVGKLAFDMEACKEWQVQRDFLRNMTRVQIENEITGEGIWPSIKRLISPRIFSQS